MDAATSAPARLLGLHHVTMPVDDLDRAVRFYRDVLGAELIELLDRATFRRLFPDRPAMPGGERATFHLGGGPSLQLFVSPPQAAARLAFTIAPTEVAAFCRRLAAAGVAHVGPVRVGPLGHASIYLHDPAGNLIELTTTGYTGALAA